MCGKEFALFEVYRESVKMFARSKPSYGVKMYRG